MGLENLYALFFFTSFIFNVIFKGRILKKNSIVFFLLYPVRYLRHPNVGHACNIGGQNCKHYPFERTVVTFTLFITGLILSYMFIESNDS